LRNLSEGTTINAENLAVDPLSGVGGQEANYAANVCWQADTL